MQAMQSSVCANFVLQPVAQPSPPSGLVIGLWLNALVMTAIALMMWKQRRDRQRTRHIRQHIETLERLWQLESDFQS